MHRIVVSDIFGKTPALEQLCKAVGENVDIIDPYAGKYMNFANEENAYEWFVTKIGLDAYCAFLHDRIERISSPATLIGFSVGASAIWRLSGSLGPEKTVRAICFYGSQVRHMLEIDPRIPVEYILPEYEPGFNAGELAVHLSKKKNVMLHRTPYMHGFMNALSTNYSKSGYTTYIEWLSASG